MVDSEKIPKDKGEASGRNIDKYDPLSLHSNETSEFLMGLDEVYALIRSIIFTTDTIPVVKGAFATLSRDESHRSTQSHNVSKSDNDNTAFVARTNPRNNNWSGSNNQPIKLNRPNLVCTHCNINGHIADRCFELVRYPLIFKRNTSTNKGSASNNVVSGIKDQSAGSSNSFTDDQYKILMALISEKSVSSSMPANIAGINCVISFCSSSQHMTYTILNMFNVVDVSKLNMTVGHPNCRKALVRHVGSLKLSDKIVIHDVLVVPGYQDPVLKTQVEIGNESNGVLGHPSDQVLEILKHKLNFETSSKKDLCEVRHKAKQTRESFPMSDHQTKDFGQLVHLDVWGPYKVQSREVYKYFLTLVNDYTSLENKDYDLELKNLNGLNFFNNDLEENFSNEPYNDGRDSRSESSKGTDQLSQGGTENTDSARRNEEGHLNDNISVEADCDNLESTIPNENDNEFEDDDTSYQEFNDQFQSPFLNPDSQGVNLRRSIRKTSMPAKLSDFEVNTKVKYNIDKQVNYSKLSIENFNFSTSLNKISEPKSYNEAASDIRWIEAMNQEMKALNRNGTWIITDLHVGRKPIGSKWVFKVKYKSSGEVERFKARLVAKGFNQKEGLIMRRHSLMPCGTPIDTKESTAKPKKVVMDNPLTCINNYQKLSTRNLKNAPGKGISFVKDKDLNVNVFVDSDWAKCKATKKSMTGYLVFLEYKAMNTVTCEVIWIQKILSELNVRISLLVPIHCDNSSAIQIAANSVFHEKTKHFEIELFLLREKVSAGVVKTVKVKYADNVADVFTKRFECSRSQ
ncbi:ribonuclease H-like domain-containing protein [Tanacetum coccineum]